jgi:hypothetical protein
MARRHDTVLYFAIGVLIDFRVVQQNDKYRGFCCLQIRMLNQMSLGFCGDCRKSRYDSVTNPKKVAPIL